MKPVLLITGASRGIGAATAVLAAQQGWAVAVNYVSNEKAADRVVQQIQAAGGTAIAVQADVGDEADILRMFTEVDAKLGRISGLVNNAGVVDVTAKVETQSWARWERMMRINVLGSFACAREAVRRMSTAHGGSGGFNVLFGHRVVDALVLLVHSPQVVLPFGVGAQDAADPGAWNHPCAQ